ncbi:MAG TPA: PhzF family phenazine biosynthesis protein [Candidatus Binataceae bacterium]|nr:PhzF family phenazine biosynthesis protein [Candidatus Binataceae bacterium]
MRHYDFVTVDVFSSKPLEGNQLAVFTNATGMSDAEMQAFACETRLSETTFVFPRPPELEHEHGVRVRIFTIESEIPFAGHPTLGTAYVLAQARGERQIALDLGVGRIPVSFTERDGSLFGMMTQRDPEFGRTHRAEEVAAAAGIPLDAIDRSLPIQSVSTGFEFTIVALKSLATARALRVDVPRMREYLGGALFYFVTRETEYETARLHARMQFFGGEDPATGSAAGCAAAWMVRHGVAKSGEEVMIEQGLEILRPSRIYVSATIDGSAVRNVRVGGHVVEVMRGHALLP